MKKFLIRFSSSIFFMSFLVSCYVGPSNNELLNESDVVLTKYNTSHDFTSKKYYTVNESVYLIKDGDTKRVDSLSQKDAQYLISTIQNQMNSRNYVYVYKQNGVFGYYNGGTFVAQNPDYAFNMTLYKNTTTVTSIYPGGGYYGGYYGWGWGYYYPYYPVAYTYEYTAGLVILDMFEYRVLTNPSDKYTVQWTGVGRGVNVDSKNSNLTRVNSALVQMFEQSPYIIRSVN